MLFAALCLAPAAADTVYIGAGGDSTAAIQGAIDAAAGERTIVLQSGTHTLSGQVSVNKPDITIQGEGPANTLVQVSGTGDRFSITAANATIEELTLEKTDKTGLQNIIYIGASNATVRNNVIFGQYEMGDPQVSRAMEASAVTGLTVSGNTIHSLRQPAYFNPASGVVTGNVVYNTRGWVVVSNANLDFNDNAWGDGALPNYYDIAIILDIPAGVNNYPNIVAMSAANSNAIIENQWYSPAILSIVHVDAGTLSSGNNGSILEPYTTITPAIPRVAPGGTIYVAAGAYAETVTLNKSAHLVGAGCGQVMWRGNTITDRSILIVRNSAASADVHVEITGFSFESENNQTIRGDWSTSYAEALTLDIHDNCFAHVNSRNPGSDFAIYVDGANQTPRDTQGALRVYNNTCNVVTGGFLFEYCRAVDVLDNVFNVTYEGVTFNYYTDSGLLGEQLVRGNVFTHVPVAWAFAMNNWHGSGSYTILPSEVTNNVITDTGFSYAILYGLQASQSAPHDFKIYDNALLSGTIMVWGDYASQVLLDASGNWWGSAASPAPRINTAGTVDYTPWLGVGDHSFADPAFQGDFSTLWVSAASPQSGTLGRIQEAIDLVEGSTVYVLPGTYEEQIHITTNGLDLIGSGSGTNPAVDTIIQSPAALPWYFLTGSNKNYPIIGFDGVTGGSVQNLRVDGLGRGNANYRFIGIGFWNAGGDVVDCAVTGIRNEPLSGAQHGVGIYAYNDDFGPYTIEVADTTVDDYQKNGMALLGEGLTVDVHGCTVIGGGPMGSGLPAQNGIQIGNGAGGKVDGCTISNHLYTGGSWAATGLLPMGNATLIVTDTQLFDNYPAVFCIDGDATLTGLTVSNQHADSGDGLLAYSSAGTKLRESGPRALPDPFVPGDTIERKGARAVMTVSIAKSTFVGHDKADTWGIGAYAAGTGAVDLTVTQSTVKGWDYGVVAYDYGAPATVTANYNQILSNVSYGFVSTFASGLLDATDNWWGDATGPYDPTGTIEVPPCEGDPAEHLNADGLGNAVSDGIAYCPWLGGPATVALLPQTGETCYDPNDTLVVEIKMTDVTAVIVGGQFHLSYATDRLQYLGGSPGDDPFTFELMDVEYAPGKILYAVSAYDPLSPDQTGTMADTVLARLTFTLIGESGSACDEADLVAFEPDSGGYQTKLSDEVGGAVYPALNALPAITIDNTAPVITCPPDITVDADESCEALVDLYAASTVSFDDEPILSDTQAPGVWYRDRYSPCGFERAWFDDDYRLKHSICADDGASYRPSAYSSDFYNTQGRKYDTPGVTRMSVDLYIPADWATTGRRMAGFWGTAFDAASAISLYPIIEFTSDGGDPRFRVWPADPDVGGWQNLGLPTGFVYDAWYTLTIELAGADAIFTVGDLTHSLHANGSVEIGNVILQGHNTTEGVDYDIYWDNFTYEYTAFAIDNCDPAPTVVGVRSDDKTLSEPFPLGITTITWTATDACGNSSTCVQTVTVADNTPPVLTCPADIVVNAKAGTCAADVVLPPPAELWDNCDPNPTYTYWAGPVQIFSPYEFLQGTTTVTIKAVDTYGKESSCDFKVTVKSVNELVVDLALAWSFTGTRCITFELWECGGPSYVTVEAVLTFTDGLANATLEVPCGVYTCITARDELHTLRRTLDPLPMIGTQYVADFTGDKQLIGGNLNDDFWIDILDFGVFSWQWAVNYGSGDTTCATPYPHADISGNGTVSTEDFTFIQINFLQGHEPNCCGLPGLRSDGEGDYGPVTEISVADLMAMGLWHLAAGDLNNDGWLDTADVAEFLMGARPTISDVEPPAGEFEAELQPVPAKPAAGPKRLR